MKRGSTIFLRAVVLILGIIVLAFCLFVLPSGIRTDNTGYYRPILLGMYLPAFPFFVALYQIIKLLNLVDKGQVFSEKSIHALKTVKICTLIIGGLYALGFPYIFQVADQDDAPGVVLIGLIFTIAPMIIASFAAIFQKMLQDAIIIKSDNDLTV